MRHFVQYHNYQKLFVLPKRDPPFLEGRGYIDTSVRTVTSARGDTAFLILGIGKPKRSFFLWERFEIESVESKGEYITDKGRSVEQFLATGRGWQLIPPARLEGEKFDQFRRACADFVGFRAIDDLPYVKTLIELSERNHKSAYDDSLEAFCTALIALDPENGEAYYYRGLVREYLGRRSQANGDFREAVNLLTGLLACIEESVPEEERSPECMERLSSYIREATEKVKQTR